MPCTPERAAFISSEWRIVKFGPNPTIVSQYGEAARSSKEPRPSCLESKDDAQAIVNSIATLISANRMRFGDAVDGASVGLAMDYSSVTPSIQKIDDDYMADMPALVAAIAIEFESDSTTIESFG